VPVSDKPQAGSPISLDPRSAMVTPQAISVLMEFRPRGAGTAIPPGDLFEVIMSNDGASIPRKPVKVLARGAAGTYDSDEVAEYRLRNFGDKRTLFYDAAGAGLKQTALALTDKRDPRNTFHELLVPALTASLITRNYSFKGATALTDDLIIVKSDSSVADPIFDSTGMRLILLNGEDIWFFEKDGFNPNSTPYADVYLKGWRIAPPVTGDNVPALWAPYIGFAGAKTIAGAHDNMLFLSNGEGTISQLTMQAKVNGAQPQVLNDSEYYWGVGYGASSSSAARRKNTGVRLFAQDNVAITLGEGVVGIGGNTEVERFQTPGGINYATLIDKSKTLYRSFGFKGLNPDAATPIFVEGLVLRGPNPNSGTGDDTAPTITSSPTGSITENSAYSTMLTANEAATWSKRVGAD
jgi:hypothetical protein